MLLYFIYHAAHCTHVYLCNTLFTEVHSCSYVQTVHGELFLDTSAAVRSVECAALPSGRRNLALTGETGDINLRNQSYGSSKMSLVGMRFVLQKKSVNTATFVRPACVCVCVSRSRGLQGSTNSSSVLFQLFFTSLMNES